jgi:hypothetical protein
MRKNAGHLIASEGKIFFEQDLAEKYDITPVRSSWHWKVFTR